MDATWQRLPVSRRLPEPLPVVAVVESVENRSVSGRQSYDVATHAILGSLQSAQSPIVLEAVPGGGKTSALRWTARTIAQRILRGDEKVPLPVYIDLGQSLGVIPTAGLEGLCDQWLKSRRPIDYGAFGSGEQPRIFLLDGLDLIDSSLAGRLLSEALNSDTDQFLFAGRRQEAVAAILDDWPSSVRIRLGALERHTRTAWLRNNVTTASQLRFQSIVTRNPLIESLLDVPLLFAMTASVSMDDGDEEPFSTDEYPGRTGIFSGFVSYAIRRAIREGQLSHTAEAQWHACLPLWEEFCLAAIRSHYFDRIPAQRMSAVMAHAGQLSLEWSSLLRIPLAAGLLYRDKHHYSFLHQQFAEYFAGRALARQCEGMENQHGVQQSLHPVLERRDCDAVAAHAITTLSATPSTKKLVPELFAWIASYDLGDACDLFSKTGTPAACDIIRSVAIDPTMNPLTRLEAIESLGRIPHLRTVEVLSSVVHSVSDAGEFNMARAALLALGALHIPASQAVLDNIAICESLDTAVRTRAVLVGAHVDSPLANALASEALSAHANEEDVCADVMEILARFGTAREVDLLSALALSFASDSAMHINARSAIARLHDRLATSGEAPAAVSSQSAIPYAAEIDLQRAVRELEEASRSVRRMGTTAQNASESGRAGSGTSWANEIAADSAKSRKWLDELFNAMRSATAAHSAIHQADLLSFFTGNPTAWQSLLAHPRLGELSPKLLTNCAKACGFRYLPFLEESSPPPASASEASAPRISAEIVMQQYLISRQQQGGAINLRDAEQFSRQTGSNWSRSTLGKTRIWATFLTECDNKRISRTNDRRRKPRRRRPE